jgi:GT2 family glycosyltransferase
MSSPLASLHIAITQPASSAKPTLESLRAQTERAFEVVVVDNASQDGTAPWARGEGPDVMVLRNFRDQGFVKAHNQALTSLFARWSEDARKTRWIGLLSSRVMLAPDCLAQLLQAAQSHPDVAVFSPKVRAAHLERQDDRDEPQLVDTGIIEEVGRTFSKSLELMPRGQGTRDEGQYDGPAEQVLPGPWCLFVRADVLMRAKVGEEWLDASLPEQYAVLDLVWRLQMLGEPMMIAPQALAWVQRPLISSLGWVGRLRRWYGLEASRARAARSYLCVLRIKQATWQQMVYAMSWLVASWIVRLLEVCADPRIIPAILRSWFVIPGALRARGMLRLARRVPRG